MFYEDDRLQSVHDIFPSFLTKGQINISKPKNKGVIVAWHAHIHQTDYWYCIQGSFKVGLMVPCKFYGNAIERYSALTKKIDKDKEYNKRGFIEEYIGAYRLEFHYLSDKNPTKHLTIDPFVWHGYMPLEENSIMLYYLNKKYDPEDVYKTRPGYFWDGWEIQNR